MYSVLEEGGDVIYKDNLENISIRLPKINFDDLILLPDFPLPEQGFINNAFASPIDSPKLREIAAGKKRAVILVSDSTRNVPTSHVLPSIVEELSSGGIKMEDITLVVATGVHRPASEDEMKMITGKGLWGKVNIENHDPYDDKNLVSLGNTSRGTPFEVNRKVYESDLRIVVGKVEPHEFAGFSGARKSILPGVCSERTILVNHRPEMILHPAASIGIMEGNPVSDDMIEAAAILGVHFAVNILVDPQGKPFHVTCGHFKSSHEAAVSVLKKFISLPLKKHPEIAVVTPGYPLNINMYQTIKSIIAMAPVMNRDGVLVLYSDCTEGTDSPDMLHPFEEGRGPEGALDFLNENYKIQMDHSLLLCKILKTGLRIVFHSPNISPDIPSMMGLIPAESPEDALEKARQLAGKNSKVAFIPCPQRALPFVVQ